MVKRAVGDWNIDLNVGLRDFLRGLEAFLDLGLILLLFLSYSLLPLGVGNNHFEGGTLAKVVRRLI